MHSNSMTGRNAIHSEKESLGQQFGTLFGAVVKSLLAFFALLFLVVGGFVVALLVGLFLLVMFGLSKTGFGRNVMRKGRTQKGPDGFTRRGTSTNDSQEGDGPVLDARKGADGWVVSEKDP